MVRDCLSDLIKHCLKAPERDMIDLSDHVDTLRTNISFILTKHLDPIPRHISDKIDRLLQFELKGKPLVDIKSLRATAIDHRLVVNEGDMLLIQADCVVNAANPTGIGCFIPGHKCVDNQIHMKAGPKMREMCGTKLAKGNGTIAFGELIVTPGFNLPAKYVFHAVGPIYDQNNHAVHQEKLIKTYVNCLDEAERMKLGSIVFPCISTGEYSYPHYEACVIAISSIRQWLRCHPHSEMSVILSPYDSEDIRIYREVLVSDKWIE